MLHTSKRAILATRLTAAATGLVVLAGMSACSTTGKAPTSAASPSSGGGLTVDKAKQTGSLNIAIGNEPPYTKIDGSGAVTGAEPDVVRAVAQRMGIKTVKGTVTPYDSMIPGLKAGRWDVVAAGLFMKQSRCSQVIYTSPVIVSTESFGVAPGNPKKILTVADVIKNPKIKVAVLKGSFEEGILDGAKAADGQKVLVGDAQTGVETVKSGRADAFLLPTLSLKSLKESAGGIDVTAPIPDAPKTGSGAAFATTSKPFADAYNAELEKFKKTPEFDQILKKWGFDPDAARHATVTELCKNKG
ncbi:ectoine/hydroxyectoine ABC transporter substrate-binding protein EhuB [Acidipropionibacterium jensenii]|uniref:Ectoine/hydroxyectoine ABC transporter substrate-binding protein EhuB n=1 Tax=Acidipropionibacterium jensenii TaxID=1749 RepID=A0A3T0RWI8_9ACTN|nr:ectoine/hydroxyectoine ABC transporter substrate-binding protein EhuB [Acidipropionibacterium jensenii]AZZ38555.1 ectoine/hydroxyectoine ABC transporter substrate-binding protein EhuB [Acidipropionibacterium jensenii]